MKKFLSNLDHWAAEAIKAIRPPKHKSSNVLTEDVHIKERQISEVEEDHEDTHMVVLPDETYLTREGQMIRNPVERKRTIRTRKKIR